MSAERRNCVAPHRPRSSSCEVASMAQEHHHTGRAGRRHPGGRVDGPGPAGPGGGHLGGSRTTRSRPPLIPGRGPGLAGGRGRVPRPSGCGSTSRSGSAASGCTSRPRRRADPGVRPPVGAARRPADPGGRAAAVDLQPRRVGPRDRGLPGGPARGRRCSNSSISPDISGGEARASLAEMRVA